jgi:ankyrin repeat protein
MLSKKYNINLNDPVVTESAFTTYPIHVAVLYSQHLIVPLLMKYNNSKGNEELNITDINIIENEFGFTPLLTAVANGDERMVRILIQYNPNPNIFSRNGRNVYFIAAERGFNSIIQLLLDNYGLNFDINTPVTNTISPREKKSSMLHISAMFNRAHTVHYLLNKGANINQLDESGHTSLEVARNASSLAAVNVFLQYCSD